jgi:hypothetical protein
MERRILCGELWPDMGSAAERYDWFDNAGAGWHFRGRGDLAWDEGPQPTSRAAAVLDLVGVDWRQPKRDMGLNHDDTGERPALPAGWPAIDSDLVRASHDIQVIDQALDDLHRKYGDDADSREDYLTLCARRVENIATLIETRSSSMVGVQAKAAAVRLRSIIEDYLRHRQIAVSLAHDLAKDDGETNSPTFEPRQKSPSPALAAIERHRDASELFDRRNRELEEARDAVLEEHGRRPIPLIAWRNYSHIGGSEIDRARREFIRDGGDPEVVKQEYRDAKKRYRAKIKAGKDWDKCTGLVALTKAFDETGAEMLAAERALGTVTLLSVGDAAALIDRVHAGLEIFGELADWEKAALRNASEFLNGFAAAARAA